MGEPLVSICVPTRNRATLLRESLRSIQGQDYHPLEIVISDNCSDDETPEVVREFAAGDPRTRYVHHARNIGLYGNHNFCIEASRGEFLCFFHDDDVREPSIVSEYVGFLSNHPEVGVVCSDWDLIGDDGRWVGAREHKVPPVTPGLKYITRTLRSGRSSVGCPGAMIRRSALADIRFDDDGAIGFGDFVVWFRLAERSAVGHINKRLWRYRIHRESLSRRTIESLSHDYEKNLSRYCDDHLRRWPEHAGLVEQWRRLIKRLLFWALLYEVALHFRRSRWSHVTSALGQTIFEFSDYRLTEAELERSLAQAKRFQTTATQRFAFAAFRAMVQSGCTWPLAYLTRHVAVLRVLLGFR